MAISWWLLAGAFDWWLFADGYWLMIDGWWCIYSARTRLLVSADVASGFCLVIAGPASRQ